MNLDIYENISQTVVDDNRCPIPTKGTVEYLSWVGWHLRRNYIPELLYGGNGETKKPYLEFSQRKSNRLPLTEAIENVVFGSVTKQLAQRYEMSVARRYQWDLYGYVHMKVYGKMNQSKMVDANLNFISSYLRACIMAGDDLISYTEPENRTSTDLNV